jgi:hypothetical protein
MADLLQALAADVIAGAGISPSAPISNHPDLLRRYTELSKVIQVWNTEGDKTAVRREVNLIKAQLSYNKDVISAQKALNTTASKDRNAALSALTKLEVAIGNNQAKMSTARNAQSEYIMHKVRSVASRPGSLGSAPRAWSALNGVLGEEGMIGRIPEPAIPVILQRMKNTYGTSGLGPDQVNFLRQLEGRATNARNAEKLATAQHRTSLTKIQDLKSKAGSADPAALGRIIKEAQGVGSKMAVFMEGEVGLTNKAELAARLENLQGQSDTLGRMEERHKALDELLGRGGGSDSERQKLANMISHPRFRAWAESNGYEANALGIANRDSAGGSAVLTSYVPGRDDLKAALHFQHQLQNPDSYRSILSPFGQRSRSGKYVVVTDKVSAENARGLVHKNGKYAASWVSLGAGTPNARLLNERQYLEHAQKYVSPEVEALTIGDTAYARAGGTYYKYLPATGKWAQTPVPGGGAEVKGVPLALATGGKYSRFATVADLTEGGGKGMATHENGNGLIPVPKPQNVTTIKALGGKITEHQQPPDGMLATYSGELLTQHAIDVRNSRDKGAVDIKVHGLNGIRTFSGDAPITIDIVQKDDETGFRDVAEAFLGARRAETALDAAEAAPANIVTTQNGAHTIIDRSNETITPFGLARLDILRRAMGLPAEGLASKEEQERFRLEQEALARLPEQADPVEGIVDPTMTTGEPGAPEAPGAPSGRPPVVTPAEGGAPAPEGTTSWEVTSGPDAGYTATILPNGHIRLAKGADVVTISAGSPDAQDLLAGAPGDVKGGRTFGRTQAAKRVSVERRAQEERGAVGLGSQLDNTMPELDQLRAASERALFASEEKPADGDLKKAARTAKKTYDKAASAQIEGSDGRRDHAAGKSIDKIQKRPAPPKAAANLLRAAQAAAKRAKEAKKEMGDAAVAAEVARRAESSLEPMNAAQKATARARAEAEYDPLMSDADAWFEESSATDADARYKDESYSGETYIKPATLLDAGVYRRASRVGVQDEPYSAEQIEAADGKPPATGDVVDDDIGAKLRSIFGLDPKGKKPEIADSAQEPSSTPGSSEVPGKRGLPAAKRRAPITDEEDEEEDDE